MDGYKIGDTADDGSVLSILNIEDLSPFFTNPVKWCDPAKLMRFKQQVEKGVKLPPISVLFRIPPNRAKFQSLIYWVLARLVLFGRLLCLRFPMPRCAILI